MSDDVIHCERCGVEWPVDLPGLDEHEASCMVPMLAYVCPCGEEFTRPEQRGRKPTYCSVRCRNAAFRSRQKARDEVAVAVLWRFPVPKRTDAPWCRECGMTLPAHWPGAPCNEEAS